MSTNQDKKKRQYRPMLIDRKHCRELLLALAPPKKKRVSKETYEHLHEVMKEECRRVIKCNSNAGKTIYPPVRLRPKSKTEPEMEPF